jgi:peptidoglycan/xylan/chitin deacetylase (PgdA/CDA1 family)
VKGSVRLDRTLSVFAAGMSGALRLPARPGIPIIMYHSVSTDLQEGGHPYYETCVSPPVFERQMETLRARGYTVIPLPSLLDCGSLPERPAVITFDDGYRDFLTNAFPILKKFGYSASVYLPTGHVEDQEPFIGGRRCLSWAEVALLHSEGILFGSHTVSHGHLHGMAPDALREEVVRSKKEIEAHIGSPVESFSYPYAFPDSDARFVRRLEEILREAGYRGGLTTRIGRVPAENPPFFLARIPANEYDDDRLFAAKLAGFYDWVGIAQGARKRIARKSGRRGRGE